MVKMSETTSLGNADLMITFNNQTRNTTEKLETRVQSISHE